MVFISDIHSLLDERSEDKEAQDNNTDIETGFVLDSSGDPRFLHV